MTDATLAPCPFCGSEDVHVGWFYGLRMAACRECGVRAGVRGGVEAGVVAAWNRLAAREDHDLATKALSAAMALNNALGALLAATDATERACAEHAARAVRAEIARQFATEEEDA